MGGKLFVATDVPLVKNLVRVLYEKVRKKFKRVRFCVHL